MINKRYCSDKNMTHDCFCLQSWISIFNDETCCLELKFIYLLTHDIFAMLYKNMIRTNITHLMNI